MASNRMVDASGRRKMPIIRVEMLPGRTTKQKGELVRKLTEGFLRSRGASRSRYTSSWPKWRNTIGARVDSLSPTRSRWARAGRTPPHGPDREKCRSAGGRSLKFSVVAERRF